MTFKIGIKGRGDTGDQKTLLKYHCPLSEYCPIPSVLFIKDSPWCRVHTVGCGHSQNPNLQNLCKNSKTRTGNSQGFSQHQ